MQVWLHISGGKVVNRIVWDGDETKWKAPDGDLMLPDHAGVDIDYVYDAASDSFTPPPAPDSP